MWPISLTSAIHMQQGKARDLWPKAAIRELLFPNTLLSFSNVRVDRRYKCPALALFSLTCCPALRAEFSMEVSMEDILLQKEIKHSHGRAQVKLRME